jgi:GT2 family glycosyltransferase
VARPAVSVVVPFRGGGDEAAAMLAGLGALRLEPRDEVIVADNTSRGIVAAAAPAGVSVVRAPARPSAFHARNAGAAAARRSWLLFTDADCVPPPGLLDLLADPEPDPRFALIAGEAHGSTEQTALLARWARSRRGPIASHQLSLGPRPAGTTANLLVRRDAFEAVGGSCEVRSDADVELCWRIQERGWALEYRPAAAVAHRDPERLAAVVRQAVGYGAGRRWLRTAYGPAVPAPALWRPLARAVAGALVWGLVLRFERAAFKLVDGAVAAALWWGYRFRDNRVSGEPRLRG